MQHKIYKLGNQELIFKDLTLDESDKVQEIIDKHSPKPGEDIQLNFTNAELKNFLGLILEEKSEAGSQKSESEIDFGKIKESVAAEIISDFFLIRIRSSMQSRAQFEKSLEDIQTQSLN